MNSKRTAIIGAIAIIVSAGFFIFFSYKNSPIALEGKERTTSADEESTDSFTNLSDSPPVAVTIHNTDTTKNGICTSLRANYANLDEIKNNEKIDLRFVNVHKKVDGIIYRLRFFYKDSSENETPTYLVYKENQNEEDILTEKSAYKKGKLYNKIEKAPGEIIYTEEGLNIGLNQNLFLHFENKVLKDLQGTSPLTEKMGFVECHF